MLFGLELAAAGLLWAHASAQTVTCSHQAPPPVRVAPSLEQIKYDNSRTQRELDRMDIDTLNPYGNKETHVGGLMSGEIRVEHKVGFVQERYEQLDQTCVHYDSIAVSMTINPTIYIAREHKPGTCRYAAIMEHEHKHVDVDRVIVNKYARRIGDALSFALNKYGATYGPFPQAEVAGIQNRLQRYIDDIVKAEVEAMNTERLAAQQAIDTLEEYERVRKLCR